MRRNAIPFGLVLLACAFIPGAEARTYYVSSSGGSDLNSGTSPASAWKTFGVAGNHINAGAFSAGDVINLKRGDTWNEQLIPPSSGTSGSPISFDAYGSGAAPLITAAAPIAFVSGSWSPVSGSTSWKATISSTISSPTVNLVQFGNVYGRKQSGGSCAAVIANKYDWCLTGLDVYVYSPLGTNPVATYSADGSIVPIMAQAAGLQMISVNGRTWLTFQHIKIQTFDYMGVSVSGASDNLVFANMESDGMVPYGTTPLGFYVNVSSGYGTSIQFLNDDAHLNFDGFRVDGAAAVTVTNCRGYANREAGLRDYTGHVTYSHSHFYGNNIAQLVPGDIVGGIAGSGNISSSIAPVVTNFNTYPARFSFTVDDVGSSPGTEAYVDTLPAVFAAHGTGTGKFNVAVVPSFPVIWTDVNNWHAAGNEIDSHSWSHQYYTTQPNPQNTPPKYPDAPAFTIQYTGTGTAATVSFDGTTFSTSVTGSSSDNLSVNLTSSPYTIGGLVAYLNQQAHYTAAEVPKGTMVGSPPLASPLVRDNAHSITLAIVSGLDIETAPYMMFYDQTRLLPDEMYSSKTAIQANVPGLTEVFYVYPDGIEDPSTEADAVAAGYTGARGSLSMKDQNNNTAGANSLYSNGVNVENLTSLGAINFHGMTEPEIDSLVATLVFRASAWGAPYGLFTHYNSRGDSTPDISNTELGYLLDSIKAHGGSLMTNAALVSAVTSGTNFSGTTRYMQNMPAGSVAVNLAVSTAGSPTVGMGSTTAYPIDINGVSRSLFGAWDVGAASYVSQRYGTGSGAGQWTMGSLVTSSPIYSAYTGQDPIQWPATIPNIGGLTNNGAQVTDTSYPSGTPATLTRCTDANSVPGYTNTGYSAGAGGSGDGILFDISSSMLHLNYAAEGGIVLMNPATGVCSSTFITQNLDLTNPGPSNQAYAFGSGAFSITTPARWIANGSTTDTSSATEVDAYTINPANGQFTHAPIADMAYGLPINANAPAWQAGHAYPYGAYISYTLTVGLATYALNTAYSLGDIVQPATGNPANCAFKVTAAGTTNTTTAPTWGSGCGVGTLAVDGSVTWKGIGGPASFVFQNVSAAGTSGGSAPSFLNLAAATAQMPGGHPDLLSTVSDHGIIWENVGVNVTAQWNDFASAGTNDAYISTAISTDTYGPGTGGYAQWNGGQGTGIFVVQYDAAANTYHLVNTATLIFTDFACPSPYTGYDCSGHLFTATALGQSTASGCETYIHNAKAADGNYVIVMQQSVIGGTTCAGGKGWVWAPHQTFNAATQFQELLFEPNHWAVMHNNLFAMTNAGYSVNAGVSSVVMPLSTPVTLPPADWVRYPCTSSTTPPYPIPPCNAQGLVDSHLGAAAGQSDAFPTAGTMFNLATNSPIEFMAWQGEEIAVSTTPTTTSPGTGPLTGSNVWRFTHTFATGSNRVFSAQWAISQFSQDGKYLAFTTDWNGQLGSTTGVAPTVANGQLAVNAPAGVTYTCLGAQVWLPSTAYATGALVGPIGSTSGSGAVYHVYQATTGGTSGTAIPGWSTTDPLGTTVSDGGITWNDRGNGDCRSDVVLAKLPLAVATYTAADCHAVSVQAAFTAEMATPADGDIIVIPACPGGVTWTGVSPDPVTVTFTQGANMAVTIQGAGATSAGAYGTSTPTGSDQTMILDGVNHSGSDPATLQINVTASKLFRMSGIAMLSDPGNATHSSNGMIRVSASVDNSTSAPNVRIDHNHFRVQDNTGAGGLAIKFIDALGVADHNYLEIHNNAFGVFHADWTTSDCPSCLLGHGSWHDASLWGSSQFMFLEDNMVSNLRTTTDTYFNDCANGGRIVIRHNTFLHGAEIQQHNGTGGNEGCRATEFYQNYAVNDAANRGAFLYGRSGGTIGWGNTMSGYANVESPYNDRSSSGQTDHSKELPNGFGMCGGVAPGATAAHAGTVSVSGNNLNWLSGDQFDTTNLLPLTVVIVQDSGTDGYYQVASTPTSATTLPVIQTPTCASGSCSYWIGSPWDGNSDYSGYPCINQMGRGKGADLLTGGYPSMTNTRTGSQFWPNEASDPIYLWNNNYTNPGSGSYWGSNSANLVPTVVQQNRDYYLECNVGGTCTSFTGATGVGQGLLSARPVHGVGACCTAGVGWWATDTNTLYTSTGAAWTTHYQPYTYPHPLTTVGGGVAGDTATGGYLNATATSFTYPQPSAANTFATFSGNNLITDTVDVTGLTSVASHSSSCKFATQWRAGMAVQIGTTAATVASVSDCNHMILQGGGVPNGTSQAFTTYNNNFQLAGANGAAAYLTAVGAALQ